MPAFGAAETDGTQFDLYTRATGKPIVMIFGGKAGLNDMDAFGVKKDQLSGLDADIVTVIEGNVAQAANEKEALDWPGRVVVDERAELAPTLENFTGKKAPMLFLLDTNQRISKIEKLKKGSEKGINWVGQAVDDLKHPGSDSIYMRIAPALIIPRVLEREDCEWLIRHWKKGNPEEGQVSLGSSAGKASGIDRSYKRRRDVVLQDPKSQEIISKRLMPRLVPEVQKVLHYPRFQMEVFRIGCYEAQDSGFFRVHRDDYNPSVKNRKFAMSVNLNSEDYEGGDLRFPEYGNELFRPPTGGAVVFSCSMLHEVTPVTRGERFVLLSFLIDPGQPPRR